MKGKPESDEAANYYARLNAASLLGKAMAIFSNRWEQRNKYLIRGTFKGSQILKELDIGGK